MSRKFGFSVNYFAHWDTVIEAETLEEAIERLKEEMPANHVFTMEDGEFVVEGMESIDYDVSCESEKNCKACEYSSACDGSYINLYALGYNEYGEKQEG